MDGTGRRNGGRRVKVEPSGMAASSSIFDLSSSWFSHKSLLVLLNKGTRSWPGKSENL